MSFSNKERLDSNENPFDHLFDQIGEVSLDALSNIYFVGRRTVKPEVLQQWFTQDRSQLWHIPAPDSQPISDERREFEGLADEFRQIWEDISSSPTIAMRAKRSLLDYQQKIQRSPNLRIRDQLAYFSACLLSDQLQASANFARLSRGH